MKKKLIIALVLSLWFTSAYWLGSYYRRAQVAGVAIQKYVDVLGTTTKCYFPGDIGSISDLFRITLAPSTIKGEYVVIEDKRLGDTENPVPYARTLYKGKNKGEPSCSWRSKAS